MCCSEETSTPHRIETPAGTAAWSILTWDSERFGMSAARLDKLEAHGCYPEARASKAELLRSVIVECRSAGVRHLSARVDTGDLSAIHALEQAGFELIDGIQTFKISLNGNLAAPLCSTRLFELQDLPEIVEIGRTAFVFDRFHTDPALPADVGAQSNESWTRNCCLGIAADAVVVAEVDGRVASYVACREDRETGYGVIVLVATAEWARRRGAAHSASSGALRWFAAQGLSTVEVGTQLRNVPAARLYENLGFRLVRTSLTFRRLL
jgi:ribosomal protein S18 acetylase RimI-like enzyme